MSQPLLDPKINYASVLSVSPSESGRIQSTVVSTSGSIYSSANRTSCELLIPPIGYADMSASYLQFSAVITGNAASNVVADTSVVFDQGACGIFESFTLYNSENQIITEIRDASALMVHKIREKGLVYANTIARNAMGYTDLWDNSTEHALATTNAEVTAAAAATATAEYFPGKRVVKAGTAVFDANVPEAEAIVQFAVPMEYFSGLFASDLYLPLKFMGSRSAALRLVLTFNPAAVALVGLGTAVDVNKLQVGYEVRNPQLVIEYCNIGDAEDAVVRNAINTSGLHYLFEDWSTKVDTAATNQLVYNSVHPKYTISLKSIIVQLRDADVYNNIRHEWVSATRRYNLASYQSQIGPNFFPNSSVQLSSIGDEANSAPAYNGACYMEFAKAAGALTSQYKTAYSTHFHVPSKAGFELCLDYDAKEKDSNKSSLTMSGKDTRSGSSQCRLMFTRNSTANPADQKNLHMTILFKTDNVLVLSQGNSYPLERA